ncbi:MAG: sigma-70 family RNA polymerase sigma factor [Oscillospiraceae bacterium]|nr:sigma-70 family RNA polymerase sigma factor [Oscillospiraceae bacterium]
MEDFKQYAVLAAKGDTEAFSRLYEMVYKDLYHIALYCLRNTHDACDAVSDTVIDAFSSIGKLKSPEAFKNWIFKILYSKIKRKQKEYINCNNASEEEINESQDFNFDSAELKEALDTLDNESKIILSLSVLEGYSSKEIAEICGIRASTVRSRLTRIKQKLRAELFASV